MSRQKAETGCCPRFNPKPWDGKMISLSNQLFLKDRVKSLFHIPLNFGSVITRNMEKIELARALPKKYMAISDENSLFGSDLYISVTKNVPGAKITKLPGTFMTKVFEGPYKNIGKWTAEMKKYTLSKGKKTKKVYYYYTTCPKCAKAYGKNYVVLLAEV